LVAAVGAVDKHSKSTLDELLKDGGKTLDEALSRSPAYGKDEVIPDVDGGPVAH
jgi:hypothetical protein